LKVVEVVIEKKRKRGRTEEGREGREEGRARKGIELWKGEERIQALTESSRIAKFSLFR